MSSIMGYRVAHGLKCRLTRTTSTSVGKDPGTTLTIYNGGNVVYVCVSRVRIEITDPDGKSEVDSATRAAWDSVSNISLKYSNNAPEGAQLMKRSGLVAGRP